MRLKFCGFSQLLLASALAVAGTLHAQSEVNSDTAASPAAPAGSPVAIHGRLSVRGTQLCDEAGNAVQLRGMSTHGIQWYGWGKFLNDGALDALAKDWSADIMRVSLYVQEGGYATNPAKWTAQAEHIIDGLVQRGLYVLIDWHMLSPGDPMVNLDRAKAYFTHMTQRYAGKPNVLYEIANEPNGKYTGSDGKRHRVDWPRIKSYAEELTPVIRALAPDSIVIVGTPDWSSLGVSGDHGPSEVYSDPITAENVMYSFHFYAADHGAGYRAALEEASERLPMFVTEWGSQEATGDGRNDFASAQAFIDLMARKKISWTSWNYSDDERSGAVFKPGIGPAGPWTGKSLKAAGKWVQARIKEARR
ncbi:glycoside hydrolase family 5 protein [Verrucomicrobiota bacterium sgz303538]